MGYSGILGYGILQFILGYELNKFWDMGYIGWFILGYGILPTPLTKPRNSGVVIIQGAPGIESYINV